jgi:hypothetical protein
LSRRQASTPFGERSELSGIPELLYEAAIKIQDLQGNEIERLRNERDEARRECCLTWESVMGRDSRDVAADKGWDCFKENNNE